LIDKPIEYFLPPTLEERRKIFYENYAASLSQTDWDKMEEEERQKIISMGKGTIALIIPLSTQRGFNASLRSVCR